MQGGWLACPSPSASSCQKVQGCGLVSKLQTLPPRQSRARFSASLLGVPGWWREGMQAALGDWQARIPGGLWAPPPPAGAGDSPWCCCCCRSGTHAQSTHCSCCSTVGPGPAAATWGAWQGTGVKSGTCVGSARRSPHHPPGHPRAPWP